MAGNFNIIVEKGYPYTRTIRWKDESGTYVDLTGYSVELIISTPITKNFVAKFISGDTILFTANPGEFIINIPSDQTVFLPSGEYMYVLRMITGNVPEKLLEGTFRVSS
jgi:hypothetical protein